MTRLLTRIHEFNGRIRFPVAKNLPTWLKSARGYTCITFSQHHQSVISWGNRLAHNADSFVMTCRMGGARNPLRDVYVQGYCYFVVLGVKVK